LRKKVGTFKRVNSTNGVLTRNAEKINNLIGQILPLISCARGKTVDLNELEGISEGKKVSLRPGVYRLRYQMIRADQEVQSKIKSFAESTLNKIKKENGTIANLEAFFFHSLLKETPSLKQTFCKLLNISSLRLEQKVRELKVNSIAHRTIEEYARHVSEISGQIHSARNRADRRMKSNLRNSIRNTYRLMRSSKSARGMEALFYKRLFDHADTKEEKELLTELLGRGESEIDGAITNLLASKKTLPKAERVINGNRGKVKRVIRKTLNEIAKLNTKTGEIRSGMMKELRLSHGMSQDHFKKLYGEYYPRFPMSDGTLSNLENNKKEIDSTISKHIGKIFGVSSRLFGPFHFADLYEDVE